MQKQGKILLLLLILFISAIAGCGNNDSNNPAAEPKTADTAAPAASGEIDPDSSKDSDSGQPAEAANNENEPKEKPSENNTVADNNDQSAKPDISPADNGEKSANTQENTVLLRVSRNFGRHLLCEENLPLSKNMNVLDLMEKQVDIETGYGGSFIQSIDGLKSNFRSGQGQMQDWFYFINGICCNVGVLDYKPRAGEVIWWDYHPWQMGPANSALIGSYPEPFLHGYKGKSAATTIACTGEYSDIAQSLQKSLQNYGVNDIKICRVEEELLKNRTGPVIVIGVWEQLQQIPYLEKLNQAYSKNGMSIYFSDDGLKLLDYSGKAQKTIKSSAGVIAASGEGLGDDSPLWLVSGNDAKGVEEALHLLVNTPEKISGSYSIAISGEEIIALPLE